LWAGADIIEGLAHGTLSRVDEAAFDLECGCAAADFFMEGMVPW
jgi:hypothetical protein